MEILKSIKEILFGCDIEENTKEDIKEDDNYIELEFSYEELEIGGNPHIDCKEFYHKNL